MGVRDLTNTILFLVGVRDLSSAIYPRFNEHNFQNYHSRLESLDQGQRHGPSPEFPFPDTHSNLPPSVGVSIRGLCRLKSPDARAKRSAPRFRWMSLFPYLTGTTRPPFLRIA